LIFVPFLIYCVRIYTISASFTLGTFLRIIALAACNLAQLTVILHLVIRTEVEFLLEIGKIRSANPEVPAGQPESRELPGAYPTQYGGITNAATLCY
jgi:hypothetical protein